MRYINNYLRHDISGKRSKYTVFFKEQFDKNIEIETPPEIRITKNKLELRLNQVWFIFQNINNLI